MKLIQYDFKPLDTKQYNKNNKAFLKYLFAYSVPCYNCKSPGDYKLSEGKCGSEPKQSLVICRKCGFVSYSQDNLVVNPNKSMYGDMNSAKPYPNSSWDKWEDSAYPNKPVKPVKKKPVKKKPVKVIEKKSKSFKFLDI
jgi:hypothetical protein